MHIVYIQHHNTVHVHALHSLVVLTYIGQKTFNIEAQNSGTTYNANLKIFQHLVVLRKNLNLFFKVILMMVGKQFENNFPISFSVF